MEILRWGIIGTGHVAKQFAKLVAIKPRHRATCVYSRTKETGLSFEKKFGVSAWHEDLNSFLENGDFDAVYIATPHNSHFNLTKESLLKGKAVLCEKPVNFSLDEFEIIRQISTQQKCLIMEGLGLSFNPLVQKLFTAIKNNVVGEITRIETRFAKNFDLTIGGRLTDRLLDGGALNEMASYSLALSHFILGEPVDFNLDSCISYKEVDIASTFLLKFPFDKEMLLESSFISNKSSCAKIFGKNGYITILNPFYSPSEIVIYPEGSAPIHLRLPQYSKSSLSYTIEAFAKSYFLGELENGHLTLEDSMHIGVQLHRLRAAAQDNPATRKIDTPPARYT